MKCAPGCACGRHTRSGGGRQRPNAEITKRSMHRRVSKERGRAAAHDCSAPDCSALAKDWAQIHGSDGLNVHDDYMPMCRSCHIRYDYDARWNPESLARWRASAAPAIAASWTPERRIAASARATAQRVWETSPLHKGRKLMIGHMQQQ